jgi:hypothetical protein
MSAHITKSALVAMVIFTREARDLPYTSILTMFFFIFMMIKMLLLEVPVDISKKQVGNIHFGVWAKNTCNCKEKCTKVDLYVRVVALSLVHLNLIEYSL